MVSKTSVELKNVGLELGRKVVSSVKRLKRGNATNREWGKELESVSESVAERVLGEFAERKGYQIHFITMPYSGEIERGYGFDSVEHKIIGNGQKKVACVYDTVDSTWNAKAGIDYTVSTMIAFSDVFEGTNSLDELTIGDFNSGVIAPWIGEGVYTGIRGSKPKFEHYDGNSEILKLSEETNPEKIRVMIDLFTARSKERHDESVDIVNPIMKEWLEFCRLYGSGVEFMSFLGRSNAEPPYGGYVSVDQKSDNLIAPSIILEGAGVIFTDWGGKSIRNRKLDERTDIAMGINPQLHNSLLKHLRNH